MLKLKELRIQKKLKQKEIADYLDIKQATYSKWEVGSNSMTVSNLKKLASLFNVSIDYLLGLTEVKTQAEAEPLLKEVSFEQKELIKKILKLNTLQLEQTKGFVAGLTITNSIFEEN